MTDKPSNLFRTAEDTLRDDLWPELRAAAGWIVLVAAFLSIVWALMKLPE